MKLADIEKVILSAFELKKDATTQQKNDVLFKILHLSSKAGELELIEERIKHLKSIGYSKHQTACTITWEYAKSKNRSYELIKRCGCYE